ncbi:hypothetical protein EK21DRAFT_59186 [Setomelanomma holmii]|uniref:Lipocalin-like domain-containing protein n=1 Tax=Setomelanomma holmii TaxID=210430 RepID=A0A9P4LMT4_9PLEO|nr:hypothetical protein EK21DRAFT_59186 [Setomelanomma holmii]
MLFRHLPAVFVACASLASAIPPSGARVEKRCTEHEIIKTFAGTYSLVNTSSALNGSPIPDEAYGEALVGFLIYTATGWISATITATEPEFRPNLTFPYKANDTDSDWAAVGKHSIGYAGPLRINTALPYNETNGQVFHGPLTVANVPTWQGASQPRNYTIIEEGGETYLKIGSNRGGGYTGTLLWKKVKTEE